jgi:hypothetical protein
VTDLANFSADVREAIEQFDCVTMHGDKWKLIRAELVRIAATLAAIPPDRQVLIDCLREFLDAGLKPSNSLIAKFDSAMNMPAVPGEAVAYLHQVVQNDGEPDQALSFWPDSFPLQGVGGFRSIGHRPLVYGDTNLPSQHAGVAVTEKIVERAIDAFELAGGDAGPASRGLAMRTVLEAVAQPLAAWPAMSASAWPGYPHPKPPADWSPIMPDAQKQTRVTVPDEIVDRAVDVYVADMDAQDLNVNAFNMNRAMRAALEAVAPPLTAQPGKHYSIDADELGIRARVADAITGALAFGAQGSNFPPPGHWLTPFWEAARADAAARSVAQTDLPFATVEQVCKALTKLGVSLPESNAECAARADELVNELCDAVHRRAVAPPDVPTGWRKFVEECAATRGGEVSGNHLAARAQALLAAAPKPNTPAEEWYCPYCKPTDGAGCGACPNYPIRRATAP